MTLENHRVKIENGRADYAYNIVENTIQKNSPEKNSEYRSYIKKLPSIIQVNGLGQALAYYFSKKGEYKRIYDQIYGWLKINNKEYFPNENEEFVKAVINMDSKEYRVITMEVLALLNWMRRFVDGMVKK